MRLSIWVLIFTSFIESAFCFEYQNSGDQCIETDNKINCEIFPRWNPGRIYYLCKWATKSNLGTLSSFINHLHEPIDIDFINSVIEEIPIGVFDEFGEYVRNLNLEYVKLREIKSNALQNLDWLRDLNLNNNAIQSIQPGCFNTTTNLQYLRISHNKLSGILNEQNFTGVGSDLEVLDLSFNNIEGIEENCLVRFKKLSSINLSHNFLSGTLTERIFAGDLLSTLDLSFNQIEHIKVNYFSNFTKLTSINLSNNRLFKVPSFVFNTDLGYLYLSNNFFKVIYEDTFPTVQEMQILDLSSNEISDISAYSGFTKSSYIADLRLANNNFVDISNFLTEPRIFEISLQNNPILIIRNKFFCEGLKVSGMDLVSVTNISMCNTGKIFDASKNQLSEMPVWTDMGSVEFIFLQQNKITSIPVGQFEGCTSLIGLNLDRNKITTLEPGVFTSIKCASFQNVEYLKTLKHLQISHNSLSGTLDAQNFTGLGKSVTELDLSANYIEDFNDSCFKLLTSLIFLNISHNLLTTLPVFPQNTELSTLIASNNNLSKIQPNTFFTPNLIELDLKFNNFSKSSQLLGLNSINIGNLNLQNNSFKDIIKFSLKINVAKLSLDNNTISGIELANFCRNATLNNLKLQVIENFSMCNTGDVFDASYNELRKMPKWTKMKSVRIVKLQHNFIEEIPM
ncbi:receptor-like protein 56, partial [Ctenocephalides felis]|uniref:receptor-like protein 56 n=1 Tax=Ctenocephalides felis TaxID=7515 RepID=UPI000E6E1704